MAQESVQDHKEFTKIVEGSLHKAQARLSGLRKANTWLLFTGIVSSAATTLVAGGTAAAGPVVAGGEAGWRIPCIVAAIMAFAATVSMALSQQLKISEQLVQGTQYVGRLRALEVAITTGSLSWEEIAKEYGEIIKLYPEIGG